MNAQDMWTLWLGSNTRPETQSTQLVRLRLPFVGILSFAPSSEGKSRASRAAPQLLRCLSVVGASDQTRRRLVKEQYIQGTIHQYIYDRLCCIA